VELLYRFYNGEILSLANTTDEADDDENDEEEDEESLADDESEVDGETADDKSGKIGIRAEKLAPRKELPPLLLPLTEVDAPRLDWIGTSFGLTSQLHKFWTRAGMRLLYLRQTTNELTGEHSAIMVRALPKRTGVSDSWLLAFVGDTKRRLLASFGGAFRNISVRLAIAVLENLEDARSTDETKAGNVTKKISADEVNYFLAPHDLKRLDLYGRNLCDHHLITDLLPVCARLYFTGRFGSEFQLSSLQAALLCGLGLQSKTVDDITTELGLPSNQVLAMFNKTLRKLSIALNTILEEKEKEEMISGQSRTKAEAAANRMRHVASRTLEEDAEDAAKEVMGKLTPST
jgi:N-acetyltransferase 10